MAQHVSHRKSDEIHAESEQSRYDLLCTLEDIKDKMRAQRRIMDEIDQVIVELQSKLRDAP
jgi:hypothetical protein